jgi:hypothetical protein
MTEPFWNANLRVTGPPVPVDTGGGGVVAPVSMLGVTAPGDEVPGAVAAGVSLGVSVVPGAVVPGPVVTGAPSPESPVGAAR